jgi:hypothetical protein
LTVPVVLLIFNRPELTAKVFREVARYKPSRLLVVADGPRTKDEALRCAAARRVVEAVDWDCEVLTDYSEQNLGCKRRVSSGLSWAFDKNEELIVLEDDCLPDPSFFSFCEELLAHYRDDERIMAISGDNFQLGRRRTPHSYYYSRYFHCWGWASWRRVWNHYDVGMSAWPAVREGSWLFEILSDRGMEAHFRALFDRTYNGLIDTWDFQWVMSCWLQGGLCVLPEVNLVSNIGYGSDATHTHETEHVYGEMRRAEMQFPLSHPSYLIRNLEADLFTFRQQLPRGHRARALARRALSAAQRASARYP